jgi:PAS domain S-box-containing protein
MSQSTLNNSFKANALDLAPVVIAVHDTDHHIIWANKAYQKATGKSLEEIKGEKCYVIWNLSRPCPGCPVLTAIETGEEQQAELTPENQDHWPATQGSWLSKATPLRDADGTIIGAIETAFEISEKKQFEAMLKRSEKEKSVILDAMSELVAYQDLEHTVLWTNRSAAAYVNEKQEKLIGRKCYEIWVGREKECDICPAAKAIETGNMHRDKITTQDGRIWIITGYPIKNETGEIAGVVVVTADMTKREQAEEELRNSRNMLQSVLDTIPSGVFWKDRDSIYRGANRTWLAWTGLKSSEEVIGKSDYELPWSKKEEADSFREDDKRVMESGIAKYDIIEPYSRSNGIRAWAKTNKVPLRDKEGHIIGILGTSEDITERRRAESALRESESRYRAFFEKGSDGVVILAPDTTRPIEFNDQACRQLGYSREEFAQLQMSDIDVKEKAEETKVHFQELVHKGYDDFETLQRTKQGEIRHVHVKAQVIEIMGNPVCHCIWRDITEHKGMEEEILKTEKLESLGILAGGIAHDFNNILTTILGNVSMAKDQAAPKSEIFELLSEAETASKRAQTLTKQLLTFAKGGMPVKETASFGDIIRESSLFVTHGSRSGCEFSIAEDLWPVEVDVGQISQVINNIVINANQAMPEGGLIKIKAENLIIDEGNEWQIKPGRYVRMFVKDEGIGISKKHLSKVFDPYFTTKQEGSGLGLSTTYSIIKKHDGHMDVESRLGIGTIFHVYLPAIEKTPPEKRENKEIKGRGKILVMDDEAPLRKMVGRMLEKLGYEPEFAKDGAEATGMYKAAKESEKPYDAVILDLTIPGGIGGKEAIQKLLEIDPEVKAIVASGYYDDPVLANFQEYGFKGMMTKPFESSSLSKVLNKVLKGEKE